MDAAKPLALIRVVGPGSLPVSEVQNLAAIGVLETKSMVRPQGERYHLSPQNQTYDISSNRSLEAVH